MTSPIVSKLSEISIEDHTETLLENISHLKKELQLGNQIFQLTHDIPKERLDLAFSNGHAKKKSFKRDSRTGEWVRDKNVHMDQMDIDTLLNQTTNTYRRSHGFGRFYCTGPVNLVSMPRILRNALLRGINIRELDMKSALPTITYQLMLKAGFECPELERYLGDRDAFLEEASMTKKEFLAALFTLGTLKTPPRYNDIHITHFPTKQIMIQVRKFVISLTKLNDQLFKDLQDQIPEGKCNFLGKFYSRLYYTYESCVMSVAKKIVDKQNLKIQAWIYDGFLVDCRGLEAAQMSSICADMQNQVRNELKLDVVFAVKNIDDEEYVDLETFVARPPAQHEEEFVGFQEVHKDLLEFCELNQLRFSTKDKGVYKKKAGTAYSYQLEYTLPTDFKRDFIKFSEVARGKSTAYPQGFASDMGAIWKSPDNVPIYIPDRRYLECNNGVIFTGNGRQAPRFLDKKDESLPVDMCAYTHLDMDLDTGDLSTPVMDQILTSQFSGEGLSTEDTQEMIKQAKMFIYGRTMFPLGNDEWRVIPLVCGESKTGKTVMGKTLTKIIGSERVFPMTKKSMADNFGADQIRRNDLIVLGDCDRHVIELFGAELFRLLVDAGDMSTRAPFGDYINFKCEAHLLITMNDQPIFKQVYDEITNRMVIFKFQVRPEPLDDTLFSQIVQTELAKLVFSSLMTYHDWMTQGGEIDKKIHSSFRDNRTAVEMNNDPVIRFLTEGECKGEYEITSDPKDMVLQTKFLRSVRQYMVRNDYPREDYTCISLNETRLAKIGLMKKKIKVCRECGTHMVNGVQKIECCTRANRATKDFIINIRDILEDME
jgi:phage/plasmid-associated DNA primase